MYKTEKITVNHMKRKYQHILMNLGAQAYFSCNLDIPTMIAMLKLMVPTMMIPEIAMTVTLAASRFF